jgi:hypothetical protein
MINKLDNVTTSDGSKFFDCPRNEISQYRYTEEHRILDIYCKSGNFLEAAYYRFMAALYYKIQDPEMRSDYILNNLLYGVGGVTEITPDIVVETRALKQIRKKFYGNEEIIGNIYSNYEELERIKGKMNFAVVIGNPPYQSSSGRASIYNKFVDKAVAISTNAVVMITRDNWMNGKAFKAMRENMFKNGVVTDIVHYPEPGETFSNVSVCVAYFKWIRTDNKNIKTKYTCIRKGKVIITQELDIENEFIYKSAIGKSIITKVGGKSNWSKTFGTRGYPFMDARKREQMSSNQTKTDKFNVAVRINKGTPIFVNIENFANDTEVRKYKVQCGIVANEVSIEKPGNVLTNIIALGPNYIGSETWSLIATFNSEAETDNCKKYIQTKFVRFLANQTVNGRSDVTDNTFACVPVQDFTTNSDIDWSQSIPEIDKQLYKKYGLSEDEIQYIESTIKEMK